MVSTTQWDSRCFESARPFLVLPWQTKSCSDCRIQAVASIYALRACTGHSNSGVSLSCEMLKRASWVDRLEWASGSTLGRNATFDTLRRGHEALRLASLRLWQAEMLPSGTAT
ncbi:hypothetical protein CgunFtcFv8_009579 [Champsocephalus gunnari]|uniref:Uncharacterized protein n=1 Tax=Champsocephalus gunnari TaxID=52237 RepID=A0AAN8GYC4_CHAGU|nr:hypothetical protein CgunFtcFv8_009579 [Champsocephalus gunnari]